MSVTNDVDDLLEEIEWAHSRIADLQDELHEATISGSKGGATAKTPTEAPDSLRSISYFKIDDLLSEGEIGGLVNGLQSVYLDKTPVANPDGSLNFTGVHVELRTGTQDQSYIPGFSSVENEISVGLELKATTPWTQSITDTDLSAIRVTLAVASLEKTDTSNGNIDGYVIQYAIDVATDGGAYQTVYTNAFNGKTTGEYDRSVRIDLPSASMGWVVRVRRITPNANSATVADTTSVRSYTEIIDAKLRYPNSAHVGISGDASQFSNIPARSYDCWGRIVKVPSNWDPTTRVYTGVWDGTFKLAWTDNPAWIYYDIYTQDRFGLGDIINASLIDKWGIYQIAQYCDVMVSDGKGGQEPRFTCNAYLQSQADAYKLLSDLASVFRGISYWMGGAVTASADMPSDAVYTYTQSNVIDGKFTYQSTSRKVRYTTALVTWNDPSDFYNQKVEYVENREGLARYGIQQTEFVAFGCTSQGQAHRAGQWALLSSQLETDSTSFAVGLEGTLAAPGQIINVQDASRAGARQGGRISAATLLSVTVDRAPDVVAPGDTLTVILPNSTAETRVISSIVGTTIRVGSPFSAVPTAQSVWAVEGSTLALQKFRVTNVTETKSDTGISFAVSAMQHVAGKFANIDDGTAIQIPPTSRLPASLQDPPTGVVVGSHQVVTQGISTNVMTISWTAAKGADNYRVEWQKDNGQWIQAGTVATTSIDVSGIYTGSYVARVTAINSGNVSSLAALSAATDVLGKTGAPPSLTSLTATGLPFGIRLDWGFPEEGASDTQRTEIWQATTNLLSSATKLGDFAYPQNTQQINGLSAGASLFFWGRLVDKTGNIGPWYPLDNGVHGTSLTDPDDYQDYWRGLIGESALQADLLTKIDAAGDLANFINAPAYVQANAYPAGAIVSYNGELYRSSAAIAAGAALPGANASWVDVGTVNQTAYGLAAEVHDASTAIDTLNGVVTATATKTDGVYAQVNPKGAGELTAAADGSAGAWTSMPFAGSYTYSIAQVTNDTALSTRIDTVNASVSGAASAAASASLSAQASANKLSSAIVFKAQVAANGSYYMAGIGIGVDYAGGTVTSQVQVNATTFSVFDATSGSPPMVYPFVIQGGQVFISQALIGTGWITNAMIGDTIQSTNYVAGTTGWKINKSGNSFELNGSTGSGRMVITNGLIQIFDAAGTQRVKLGLF